MSDLPPLPPLEPAQVDDWLDAHRRFADADAATAPAARAVARRLFRRQLIDGLANVQPVFADMAHPLLFPPPRRFLTRTLEQRLTGAEMAFRHLDVAAAMHRMEGGPAVVTGSMPHVLNALLSGPVTGRETNPGLLRMSSTHWRPGANPFQHPEPSTVRDLLAAAIDVVTRAPVPAIARAGWLAFVMMTVHPFVDGNGRTGRALFMAVASADTPVGLDWGVLEQWCLARDVYLQALQAGQRAEKYSGPDVDPGPFMRFGVQTSTRGARMNTARFGVLEEFAEALDGDDDVVELLLRVMVDRYLPLDTLLDESESPTETLDRVGALVNAGHLRFGTSPAGRSPSTGVGRGLLIGDQSMSTTDQLCRARYQDA